MSVVRGADSRAPTPMDMLEAVNKFRAENGGHKPLCWSAYNPSIMG